MSDEVINKRVVEKRDKTGLNRTQARIPAEIRNNPNITRPQLVVALGVGKSTIDRGIASLRKAGRIERIGSNKSDYWKVNDEICEDPDK